jgi:hypothetical protein
MNARATVAAVVVVMALSAGCLPRGEPPAGRQVLPDRRATLVGLLPPTGDGVLRAFYTLPTAQPEATDTPDNPVADLYEVSVDSTGGPPVERLLVPRISAADELGCIFNVAPCGGIDPRGVTVFTDAGPTRADAITGDVQQFTFFPYSSPSQRRFFVSDSASAVTLYDVDGQMTVVNDASATRFIGEDFFYVTSQGDLMDIPPSGVAEQVATGLVSCADQSLPGSLPSGLTQPCVQFSGQVTPDGIVLLLVRPSPNPNVQLWSVRDPLTGTEMVLPFDGTYAEISPYGRWLLDTGNSDSGQFTFFDYRTGDQQEVDIPDDTYTLFMSWRPGSAQVWFTGLGTTVWILEPGKPAMSVDGRELSGYGAPDASGRGSPFTPDGAYWFSSVFTGTSTPVLQVGAADDPNGPLFDLNSPQQYIDPLGQLADDRLLVSVSTKMEDYRTREDTSSFDPRTGQSVPLGTRGRVAAIGQTRMMGMFHWDEMRGDLTVFDVATGQPTVLAPEFTVTAFAEPQGADQLAPGTRIVYQFQARTESPYDGIWVATCP